jgi:hypothetical protein
MTNDEIRMTKKDRGGQASSIGQSGFVIRISRDSNAEM